MRSSPWRPARSIRRSIPSSSSPSAPSRAATTPRPPAIPTRAACTRSGRRPDASSCAASGGATTSRPSTTRRRTRRPPPSISTSCCPPTATRSSCWPSTTAGPSTPATSEREWGRWPRRRAATFRACSSSRPGSRTSSTRGCSSSSTRCIGTASARGRRWPARPPGATPPLAADRGGGDLRVRLDLRHGRAEAHDLAPDIPDVTVGEEQGDRGAVGLLEAAHEGPELALALELLLDGPPRGVLHHDDLPHHPPHHLVLAIAEDAQLLRVHAHHPHPRVQLVHADPGRRLLEGLAQAQGAFLLPPVELVEVLVDHPSGGRLIHGHGPLPPGRSRRNRSAAGRPLEPHLPGHR